MVTVNTNRWNRVRYTLYAPFYDLIVRRIGRGRRRAIELLNVQPGERVLIDGCGTGLDLELLPRGCHITAIDITPAMVEKPAPAPPPSASRSMPASWTPRRWTSRTSRSTASCCT